MKWRTPGLERTLLALFIASGFAGLIYQSIWSHYLGLSLGHAAYAQTLVLAIFMGGMALGAWLVSRFGVGWRRLVLAYAIVEILVGVAGLAFHPVFLAYTGFSQDTVFPLLESPAAARAWQWGSAALLIAPQSILLGMTFPLVSGGYLRLAPRSDGEILGGLYFSNSIGAAFGALVATFVLLPWIGMPGAIGLAGVINLAVGLVAWGVARQFDGTPADNSQPAKAMPATAPASQPEPQPQPQPQPQPTEIQPREPDSHAAKAVEPNFQQFILVAAGITGASSFVYEIGWVRMLNQALGTTVHSFELMLAAFILGLAFGGLWVRRRSKRIVDAVSYAGYAQIAMGLAALLSLPVFNQSFRWVGALMASLARNDSGYFLFSAGSAGIALLVMFPAAFFAGMTLPLFTMALLRLGAGEASIGRVYAANTLGAILGVAMAVHLLIPLLGLQLAVTLAALADVALGFALLRLHGAVSPGRRQFSVLLVVLAVLAVSLVAGRPDPSSLVSGVFRTGRSELPPGSDVVFLRDGKTATVAVYGLGTVGSIVTNGKPDATLQMDPSFPPRDDEVTMLMLGALPLAVHPKPSRVAIIGWGSGLTTHTVLGSPVPEAVDSIEIERAMYDGALLFRSRVSRAYVDPRSAVHFDDARTYFSTGKRRYDVIVSEPSNPWVSGVASLFTRQFYQFLSGHLEQDGIVVQWTHAYELNDRLLSTMMSALVSELPYVDVYLTNHGDLVLVAGRSPLPALRYPAEEGSVLAQELARVGLRNAGDFAVRRIGDQSVLQTLAALNAAPVHDDFHPEVSLQAPGARFRDEKADQLERLLAYGMPLLEIAGGRVVMDSPAGATEASASAAVQWQWRARQVRDALAGGGLAVLASEDVELAAQLSMLRELSRNPMQEGDVATWQTLAANAANASIAHLSANDLAGAWIGPAWFAAEGQPDVAKAAMAAYDAAARRDAPAMRRFGLAALAQVDGISSFQMREHMLAIAILGALGEGDGAGAQAIDREFGSQIILLPGSDYGFIRAYLMAWSDRVAG